MTPDSWSLPYRPGRQLTAAAKVRAEAQGDAVVIKRSQHSPEAFGEIYDLYVIEVHRFVARRLGPDVADDLAAETFLVAFRQRARYDLTRSSARPWLYGIATNLMRRHRRQEIALYRALARSGELPATGTHDEDRVDTKLSAQSLRPELMRALAGLSARDRDVLLLAALAELSRDEIAQALGIPHGTVGSRLHRARRKLRAALPPSAVNIEAEVSDHG